MASGFDKIVSRGISAMRRDPSVWLFETHWLTRVKSRCQTPREDAYRSAPDLNLLRGPVGHSPAHSAPLHAALSMFRQSLTFALTLFAPCT